MRNFIKKLLNIIFLDISATNERIFNLPLTGVSPKEITFNKHMQNLVWVFWFGKLLHIENDKEVL